MSLIWDQIDLPFCYTLSWLTKVIEIDLRPQHKDNITSFLKLITLNYFLCIHESTKFVKNSSLTTRAQVSDTGPASQIKPSTLFVPALHLVSAGQQHRTLA